MDAARQAVEVLQEAEGRLRGLMSQEIACRRYSELPVLASFADGLAALLGSVDVSFKNEASEEQASVAAQNANASSSPRRRVPASVAATKSPKKTSKYPYFEIEDGWIGKVGWSKKNREEYRHYAPVSAAVAIAEHVDTTQNGGRVWTVEDLGEVVDAETGEALPSYQLYLVIAWMRSAGLLIKQGRSGYVAVGGGKLLPGVKDVLGAA